MSNRDEFKQIYLEVMEDNGMAERERRSSKVHEACSVSEVGPDRNVGVWFMAGCSGMLYRNHKAAGDVDLIIVDGVSFEPTKEQNEQK